LPGLECPAWSSVRRKHTWASRAYVESWPSCLSVCGIMPCNVEIRDSEPRMSEDEAQHGDMNAGQASARNNVISVDSSDEEDLGEQSPTEMSRGPYGEAIVDGMIVVFTDGACRDNQNKALRKAGLGGFWGDEHPFNFSEPLREGEQTNNRAELVAVIRVLQLEMRAVDIRTDSKYVYDGATKNRFKWRSASWRGKRRQIANAELWIQLDGLLESRTPGSVRFTKVKAHTTQRDVSAGAITEFDRAGNEAADALAVAGACRGHGQDDHRRQAWLRATVAICVQRMMLDIYRSRHMACQDLQADVYEQACSDSDEDIDGQAPGDDNESGVDSDATSECLSAHGWISVSSSADFEMEPD